MPQKKKQHYVPRCLLKRFSENCGKSINLHNLKSDKTVLSGNLYNQCYKDYLYGKDGLFEDALHVIETAGAKVISAVDQVGFFPRKGTEQYYTLLVFVLFQRNRTLAAGEALNEQMDHFHDNIWIEFAEAEAAKHGITRQELEEITIRYQHPERAAVALTAQFIPLALDLNMKVLKSTGALGFIASDNPVIFYNPFSLGAQKREGSATGLQSKGLQIYMPISSMHTLLYYDSDVYKVGDRKQTVVAINEQDVRSLNFLQILDAVENLYFQSAAMASYVEKEALRAKSKRLTSRSGARVFPSSQTSDIVHFYHKDIVHKAKLSFYKQRETSPKFWDPRVIPPRNTELSNIYSQFLDEFNKGKWKMSDFGEFLNSLHSQ